MWQQIPHTGSEGGGVTNIQYYSQYVQELKVFPAAVSPSPSLGFMAFQSKSRWIMLARAAHKRMPHKLSTQKKYQKPDSMKNDLRM